MRLLKLNGVQKNKRVIVDDDVFNRLAGSYVWLNNAGYPEIQFRDVNSKKTVHILLHRVIAGAIKGEYVDHISRNILDNRRSNLRVCTPRQNNANRGKPKNERNPYKKGVRKISQGSWESKIRVGTGIGTSKQIVIGYFKTEEEAHLAYAAKAKEFYGEFARMA